MAQNWAIALLDSWLRFITWKPLFKYGIDILFIPFSASSYTDHQDNYVLLTNLVNNSIPLTDCPNTPISLASGVRRIS
jgi:hypothetical protein